MESIGELRFDLDYFWDRIFKDHFQVRVGSFFLCWIASPSRFSTPLISPPPSPPHTSRLPISYRTHIRTPRSSCLWPNCLLPPPSRLPQSPYSGASFVLENSLDIVTGLWRAFDYWMEHWGGPWNPYQVPYQLFFHKNHFILRNGIKGRGWAASKNNSDMECSRLSWKWSIVLLVLARRKRKKEY